MRSLRTQSPEVYNAASRAPYYQPPPFNRVGPAAVSVSAKWSPPINIVITKAELSFSYSSGSSRFALIVGANNGNIDVTDAMSVLMMGGQVEAWLEVPAGATYHEISLKIPLGVGAWMAIAEFDLNLAVGLPIITFQAEEASSYLLG
jgi:hypothetical protein